MTAGLIVAALNATWGVYMLGLAIRGGGLFGFAAVAALNMSVATWLVVGSVSA